MSEQGNLVCTDFPGGEEMKNKYIMGKCYHPIQVENRSHAEELLAKNKIVGYAIYDGIIVAYFPI